MSSPCSKQPDIKPTELKRLSVGLGAAGLGASQNDEALALRARYEAVLEMAASLRSRSGVAEFGGVLNKNWRFCANVQSWCLLSIDDGGLSALVGKGRQDGAEAIATQDLPASAEALWKLEHPRQWPRASFLAAYPDLSPWFGEVARGEIIAYPRERRGQRFVIVIGSGPEGLQRLDYKFIETVAAMFISEVAYHRTIEKLTRNLEREAREDPLTGVANRRHFLSMLDRHWNDAMRRQTPLSLLMLDIDHFKLYNDRYGHPMGDECIRAAAAEMVAALSRPFDLVGRLGGEEFAILLPGTTGEGAMLVGQRVIDAIDARAIPHSASLVCNHVTVSMGAAMRVPEQGKEPKCLIEAADGALYQAKHAGRHRVVGEGAPAEAAATATAMAVH